MPLILLIILFLFAFFVLVRSGAGLVDSLAKVTAYFRWREFFAAFVLVAFATSVPELFIGILSASNNISNLSLGNVLGANLINATLIMGLPALWRRGGLKTAVAPPSRDLLFSGAFAIVPVFMGLDKIISRLEGIFLIILFVVALIWQIRARRDHEKKFNHASRKDVTKEFGKFVIWLFALLFAAQIVVSVGARFAAALSISLLSLGAILFALGTTLPELMFDFQAIKRRHEGMVFGNLVGTMATNALFITGLVAIISPITIVNYGLLLRLGAFTIFAFAALAFFRKYRTRIALGEGLILLAIYLMFVITEYFVSSA